VIDQGNHAIRADLTIQGNASHSVLHSLRILHRDVIGRGVVAIGNFVAVPIGWNAWIQAERTSLDMETEDVFQADPIKPSCRAGVPGPAPPPGVRRLTIDVPGDDI